VSPILNLHVSHVRRAGSELSLLGQPQSDPEYAYDEMPGLDPVKISVA
jgi:hypothetical protein